MAGQGQGEEVKGVEQGQRCRGAGEEQRWGGAMVEQGQGCRVGHGMVGQRYVGVGPALVGAGTGSWECEGGRDQGEGGPPG